MKPDKRKLAVIGMLVVIVVFIIIYSMTIIGEGAAEPEHLEETQVPELKEEKKQYDSRLEAVDNLSEKKPVSPPGLYDEDLIDSNGHYDPYLDEKEKIVLMDSILSGGPDMEDYTYEEPLNTTGTNLVDSIPVVTQSIGERVIGQGHSMFFFSSAGLKKPKPKMPWASVRAEVNGDQVVRKDQRLELKLSESLIIEGDTLATNTILYAFCNFQPNRLLLKVQEVGQMAIQLEAYDISDGQKGIYIENSFRSQAATEVIDDVIQDINISGVPQVNGLKGIFQRSNRSVKVKVLHQYQLILKPVL